jgi:transcriptional regulator with XRE-family HTH domain
MQNDYGVATVGIVGERLAAAIKLRKTTAANIVRASGVDSATISLIMSGKRPNTSAIIVAKLANALEVSVDYLVGLSDNPERGTNDLPEQVRQLARLAGKLSEKKQEELLRIAATLEELERENPSYTIPAQTFVRLVQMVEKLGTDEDKEDMYGSLHDILDDDSASFLGHLFGEDNGQPLNH